MKQLTAENYKKGFLIDEKLMAGVSDAEEGYLAFVLDHSTGEYLGYQTYPGLEPALSAINQIERQWSWESTSACGEGKCGEGAQCGTGLCPKVGGCAPIPPL